MNATVVWIIHGGLMLALLGGAGLATQSMVSSASDRLVAGPTAPSGIAGSTGGHVVKKEAPAIAAHTDVEYCSEQLKTVLRRVLTNCGLIGAGRRGCQPGELRNVAQISDADFNALFVPLQKRGGIILFDKGKDNLDDNAKRLLETLWSDRRGASYFFIVGRASTDGRTETNRALSHRRVNSALFYLQERFGKTDPELEQQVGLLWLGEEYAQLGTEFCQWQRTQPDAVCSEEVLNRSTILSWIDCRL